MANLEAKRYFVNEINFYAFNSFEILPDGYADHEVKSLTDML